MINHDFKKERAALEQFLYPKKKRASKYRAVKTKVGAVLCDSKGEAQRYRQLLLLENAGKIQDLKHHVAFPLNVNGFLICKYEADFTYTEDHKQVVEDFKGVRTAIYRLKKKLMKAIYDIEIRESGK